MTNCPDCDTEYEDLRTHLRSNPSHIPKEKNVCHECGRLSTQVANHWRQSSTCNYPEITDYQMDVLTGILMSDGWLSHKWKNCSIEIEITERRYLKFLNEQVFPLLGTQVSLMKTGEECISDSNIGSDNPEDYSDQYGWRTIKHPSINTFRDWIDGGEKGWPDELELTPTTLKHLYIGDGSFHQKDKYMKITTRNEMDNKEKVMSIFEDSNIEVGNFRYDDIANKVDIFFSKKESSRLFNLMGNPPPGFEYKWPADYR